MAPPNTHARLVTFLAFWRRKVTERAGVGGAVALVGVLVLAGCGPPAGEGTSREGGVSGEVVVQAAASLTDAFAELVAAFEAANPDASVTLNLAGSQSLAAQVLEGAPADVFASANPAQMARVVDAGLVEGRPEVVASNTLAIAVERGNPFDITSLADLAASADPEGPVLVLAAPVVPAGALAAQALAAAEVEVAPSSLALDVRAALSMVALGEADAAIVFASDLAGDGGQGTAVEAVPIPEVDNVATTYPIAVLEEAPNPPAARAFIDLVRSAEGQAILAEHGFGPPPGEGSP